MRTTDLWCENTQQLLINMQMLHCVKCYLHTNVPECISCTAFQKNLLKNLIPNLEKYLTAPLPASRMVWKVSRIFLRQSLKKIACLRIKSISFVNMKFEIQIAIPPCPPPHPGLTALWWYSITSSLEEKSRFHHDDLGFKEIKLESQELKKYPHKMHESADVTPNIPFRSWEDWSLEWCCYR